ncbi:hypothetical protein [Undibacterium umbellatum]|uniref:Uncharacterized protein n=1 Tax=Undibacterium umbellatum TaxID=2762300 RepID=A0ABR6ZJ43_9BURK|nr:hypothetical protein [Undibacterium umbellatum]MBC3911401.1 hypothetical protein [Undibacterium umbellatum]
MSVDNPPSFRRAAQIKGAIRTPISLSKEEYDQAAAHALVEQRSVASFLRVTYLLGLKEYLRQLNAK